MKKPNKIIAYVFCFLTFFGIGRILSDVSATHDLAIENAAMRYGSKTVEITLDGEVKNPGTYSANVGETLYDVLFMAGGITNEGDLSSLGVDMVVLSDCSVTVPKLSKNAISAYAQYDIMSDGKNHRLNINYATLEQLADLDGIGETLARRIVEFREQNGDFKSTEDLLNIKGIGRGKYDKFKDYITVGGE